MSTICLSADVVKSKKSWIMIDATDVILGRLASYVAHVLRGKNKVHFVNHLDCGDNVIIINSDKIKLTGKKLTEKVYYKHTGYVGGIKSVTPAKWLRDGKSNVMVMKAVERMLGCNTPMGRQRLSNLRVFRGEDHTHMAQKPRIVDFAGLNKKNVIRG